MRETFRGAIPDDLLYDREYDMWARAEGDQVVVGATSFGIHMAGAIIAFTAKPKGATVERSRSLGTVECAKTVLAVHAPVGFILTEGNEALEEHPERLNIDAYTNWMARGHPLDWPTDSARLVDAVTYRDHILKIEPEAVFE